MVDLEEVYKSDPEIVVIELKNPSEIRRGKVVDFEFPIECPDVNEPCIIIEEFNRKTDVLTEIRQSEIKSIDIVE